jgi:hypothetical protein
MECYNDSKELENQLLSDDFVLKTQRQISKDFGTTGIDFPTDFQTIPFPVDQLIVEISIRLKNLNSSNSTSFSQLLYQIDLPELMLPDIARSDDFFGSLAEVVLRREAYKVFLRNKFSS